MTNKHHLGTSDEEENKSKLQNENIRNEDEQPSSELIVEPIEETSSSSFSSSSFLVITADNNNSDDTTKQEETPTSNDEENVYTQHRQKNHHDTSPTKHSNNFILIYSMMALCFSIGGFAFSFLSRTSASFASLRKTENNSPCSNGFFPKNDIVEPVMDIGLFFLKLYPTVVGDDDSSNFFSTPELPFQIPCNTTTTTTPSTARPAIVIRLTHEKIYSTQQHNLFWLVSQVSSTIGLWSGGSVLVPLFVYFLVQLSIHKKHIESAQVQRNSTTFIVISIMVTLTYLSQLLTLLVIGSPMCRLRGDQSGCSLNVCAYFAITSAFLWFLCLLPLLRIHVIQVRTRAGAQQNKTV